MSDDTPRLGLGQMVDGQELDAMAINDALIQLDALTDICLKGQFVNTPPASPADGDVYLLGGAPTGAWAGYAYKIAYCIDGLWRFFTPFDGLRAFVAPTNAFLVYENGTWTDSNALISANEAAIASAATCDLGAAGSLCVQITGTTTITSLGTGANLLRFVRFAQSLTLTFNTTSLILPGAANITTAADDTATFASDGSGYWRCVSYQRASGQPVAPALTLDSLGIGAGGQMPLSIKKDGFASGSGWVTLASAQDGAGNKGVQLGYLAGSQTGVIASVTNSAASTLAFWNWNGSAWGEMGRFGSDGGLCINTVTSAGRGSISCQPDTGVWGLKVSAPNSGGTYYYASFAGGSGGSISGNGSVTAYNTTSDARLKTVAAEQGDYRAAIRGLWVGDFHWKDGGAPGFGVLAQQAWDVMPHHAGVTRPTDEAGAWQASAEPFAFLALWGVKDLYAMAEALAVRVAALEAGHAAG